jgi:hypothetical protein
MGKTGLQACPKEVKERINKYKTESHTNCSMKNSVLENDRWILGVTVHSCNPRAQEAETGGWQV